jgi:hypothetical protein
MSFYQYGVNKAFGKFSADKTKVFQDTTFKIDRPKGFVKTWNLSDGKKKMYTYPVDYGYFPKLKGEDGEGLDAFVGDDPNGHYESFVKLFPDGKVDETKFLVGVTDNERRNIYSLYGQREVSNRVVYDSLKDLLEYAQSFKGKKREKTATVPNPAQEVTPDKTVVPKNKRPNIAIKQGAAPGLAPAIDETFKSVDRGESIKTKGEENGIVEPFENKAAEERFFKKLFKLAENDGISEYAPLVSKPTPSKKEIRTGIELGFRNNETFDRDSGMTMPGTLNRDMSL